MLASKVLRLCYTNKITVSFAFCLGSIRFAKQSVRDTEGPLHVVQMFQEQPGIVSGHHKNPSTVGGAESSIVFNGN